MPIRLIRLPEVINKTGLPKSTIYNKVKNDNSFPKQIKLSDRSIAFIESEIDSWIDTIIAQSRSDGGLSL